MGIQMRDFGLASAFGKRPRKIRIRIVDRRARAVRNKRRICAVKSENVVQPACMIAVGMRQKKKIEFFDAQRTDIAQDRLPGCARFVAAVYDHRLSVGKFDDGAVALPHVEKMHAQFSLLARRYGNFSEQDPKIAERINERVDGEQNAYRQQHSRKRGRRNAKAPVFLFSAARQLVRYGGFVLFHLYKTKIKRISCLRGAHASDRHRRASRIRSRYRTFPQRP